jgi:uncharacterized membrane protein
MSFNAAILIIISAFMHALWNFFSKRRNPSVAFFFITTAAATIIISPVLFMYWQAIYHLPGTIWLLLLATGVAQMVYFSGLAGAYSRGDMSLAYPLARALPVLMVTAVSFTLGNGSDIAPVSVVGMFLITVGCIILPFPHFRKMKLRTYFDIVTLMAIVAAVGTTGYTLIDDYTLKQLRYLSGIHFSNNEATLLFVSLQTTSTTLILGLSTLAYRSERQQLRQLFKNRNSVLLCGLTGMIIMVTYGLVLLSMAYVTNVSYVAAFRQLSIPIGAALGMTLQKEPRYMPKLIGIGIVSIGLLLVGLG